MSERTELRPASRSEIIEKGNDALAEADRAAAAHVFADYRSRKAANTLRTQDAALALFADYIKVAGVAGVLAEDLQNRPEAWRGVSWGLVEGFVRWLLRPATAWRRSTTVFPSSRFMRGWR